MHNSRIMNPIILGELQNFSISITDKFNSTGKQTFDLGEPASSSDILICPISFKLLLTKCKPVLVYSYLSLPHTLIYFIIITLWMTKFRVHHIYHVRRCCTITPLEDDTFHFNAVIPLKQSDICSTSWTVETR